jgi:hypothetical protein
MLCQRKGIQGCNNTINNQQPKPYLRNAIIIIASFALGIGPI